MIESAIKEKVVEIQESGESLEKGKMRRSAAGVILYSFNA